MKRSSTWAGIIGGLLIASFGVTLASTLVNKTDLFLVNVAIWVTNILWIVLGVFLIVLFVKLRQKEDLENGHSKPAVDGQEDVELLKKQRNWIFAFVLIVQILGSIGTWILNDYTVGLTLINAAVVFDLFINVIFLYIIIEFLRGKNDILQLLLYIVIIHAAGSVLIDGMRGHWFGPLMSAVFAIYFVYAIKAPVNRKNHRIAHLVIFPTVVILGLIGTNFDNGNILDLTKKEALAEQQFSDETAMVNSAYMLFLQREVPGRREIDDVRNALKKREIKIGELIQLLDQLEAEYQKQLPSIEQKKTFERMRYIRLIMDTHRVQAGKVEELMDYAQGVNFGALTDQQITRIRELKDAIDALSAKFTEIQFEEENANLNG